MSPCPSPCASKNASSGRSTSSGGCSSDFASSGVWTIAVTLMQRKPQPAQILRVGSTTEPALPDSSRLRSHSMRRLLLTLPLIALCAWAPTAGASARQVVTFEAPRELLSGSTRAATLDQIQNFGVTRVRQLVYWRDFAPDPDSKTKPAGFDASDPAAYPAEKWDNLDGLIAAARERKIDVMLTLTGPVPRWATKSKKDNFTEPDAKEFQAFATAMGRRYGDSVSMWSVWNEPN